MLITIVIPCSRYFQCLPLISFVVSARNRSDKEYKVNNAFTTFPMNAWNQERMSLLVELYFILLFCHTEITSRIKKIINR